MPVVLAGLMCHAPIVLPVVAGSEARRCARTTRAMREVAERVVRRSPDRLVLVSPHSPRLRDRFGAWEGVHRGDLAAFRVPGLQVELPDAPEVAAALGLPRVGGEPLDHGAMVPLAFLWEAGWRGPTAILSVPWEAGDAEQVGRGIAALPGRSVVVASGDMSHRLLPGAPSGFHPDAWRFDHAFVRALEDEDWAALPGLEARALAAEDVVDSTRVATAAAATPLHAEVLAYEGPWGVGYTEAIFADEAPPLYAMARMAVRDTLRGRRRPHFPGGGPARGVFVTMRQGLELRGCVGSIDPQGETLHDEVVASAIAALGDGRMPAPTLEELPDLRFEVSVLGPLEPVEDPAQLDPRRYGVLVGRDDHHGLLLPDLEGVDTVADQLAIARRKAGLRPDEPVTLQRFTVLKEVSP